MKRSSPRKKPTAKAKEPTAPILADSSPNDSPPEWPVVERDALEHIRLTAYYKWQEAGSGEGDGAEYWLAAEREYLAAHAMPDPSGEGDVVQNASEESFPASDPPAWSGGRVTAVVR